MAPLSLAIPFRLNAKLPPPASTAVIAWRTVTFATSASAVLSKTPFPSGAGLLSSYVWYPLVVIRTKNVRLRCIARPRASIRSANNCFVSPSTRYFSLNPSNALTASTARIPAIATAIRSSTSVNPAPLALSLRRDIAVPTAPSCAAAAIPAAAGTRAKAPAPSEELLRSPPSGGRPCAALPRLLPRLSGRRWTGRAARRWRSTPAPAPSPSGIRRRRVGDHPLRAEEPCGGVVVGVVPGRVEVDVPPLEPRGVRHHFRWNIRYVRDVGEGRIRQYRRGRDRRGAGRIDRVADREARLLQSEDPPLPRGVVDNGCGVRTRRRVLEEVSPGPEVEPVRAVAPVMQPRHCGGDGPDPVDHPAEHPTPAGAVGRSEVLRQDSPHTAVGPGVRGARPLPLHVADIDGIVLVVDVEIGYRIDHRTRERELDRRVDRLHHRAGLEVEDEEAQVLVGPPEELVVRVVDRPRRPGSEHHVPFPVQGAVPHGGRGVDSVDPYDRGSRGGESEAGIRKFPHQGGILRIGHVHREVGREAVVRGRRLYAILSRRASVAARSSVSHPSDEDRLPAVDGAIRRGLVPRSGADAGVEDVRRQVDVIQVAVIGILQVFQVRQCVLRNERPRLVPHDGRPDGREPRLLRRRRRRLPGPVQFEQTEAERVQHPVVPSGEDHSTVLVVRGVDE